MERNRIGAVTQWTRIQWKLGVRLLFKMALLLTLASACMRFLMEDLKVLLKPNPAFVPKVFNPALSCCLIKLSAFYPHPFSTQEHKRLNTLCTVRAICAYVDKMSGFRKSEQLFVSCATSHLGKPLMT